MNDNLMAPGLPPPDNDSSTGSGPGTLAIMVAVGGLCLAALGFAVFGIGYGLGWWGHDDSDDDTPPEQLAQAEAKPDEAEPTPAFAGAELTPEVDPLAGPVTIESDDRVLAGLEPVPEIEPPNSGRNGSGSGSGSSAGSDGAGGGGSGSDRSTGPRVSVTLVLKHYQHVEVKLGGQVLSLDSDKTVKIRPGGYRIELRKSVDAPWKAAGLIDIQVGNSYRVTLLDPPFAKLEAIK
jgi:hypothetical protein